MKIPEAVQKVMDRLESHGYQAYLVGGCVRDALMHRKPHDYDIATSAHPHEIQALFDRTEPVGIAHGTVLVIEEGMPIEVTTFRKDGEYHNHRQPDGVKFVDDILEDLARRDFTINAMAWSPSRGLIDPYGGRKDLENRLIRTVGDPRRRFDEDALRILRAWRFAAKLDFSIEEKTKKAMKEEEGLVQSLSAERVVPELEQILRYRPQLLEEMTTALSYWIPELDQMLHTQQNSPYHYTDVLHHTIDALKQMKQWDREVAWALLLHDTGKPKMKTTDEKGDHFKLHEVESAKIARRVCRKLKLPQKMSSRIVRLVAAHDTFYAPRLLNLYKLRVLRGFDDELVDQLFQVQYGDIMAHTSHDRLKDLNRFAEYYHQEKDRHPFSVKQLPVNGYDVMHHTSLRGREIQLAFDALLKEIILHPEKDNPKDALNFVRLEEDRIKQLAQKEEGRKHLMTDKTHC